MLLFIKKRFEMLSEHADNILNLFLIKNKTMSSVVFENQKIQICGNLFIISVNILLYKGSFIDILYRSPTFFDLIETVFICVELITTRDFTKI